MIYLLTKEIISMPNLFDPSHIGNLDNPGRRELLPPHELLNEFGLTSGQTFVDIGAGAGYFSIPAAEITGDTGHVIAVDLSEVMLGKLEEKAAEKRVNIIKVLSPPDSVPLPDATADMTFMSMVYHEIDDRPGYLSELKRITKPHGTLVILDWAVVESPMGPPAEHRVDLRKVIDEVKKAGFRVESNGMINPFNYFVTARPI